MPGKSVTGHVLCCAEFGNLLNFPNRGGRQLASVLDKVVGDGVVKILERILFSGRGAVEINQTELFAVGIFKPRNAARIIGFDVEAQLFTIRTDDGSADLDVGGVFCRNDPHGSPMTGPLHGVLEVDRDEALFGATNLLG